MRSQYIPRIYISVSKSELSEDDNKMRTSAFGMALHKLGIEHLRANGTYQGIAEQSFILKDNEKNRELARQTMEFYKQECILVTDNEGTGTLLYRNGNKKILGKMKVSKTKPSTDYTQVSKTKEYVTFH